MARRKGGDSLIHSPTCEASRVRELRAFRAAAQRLRKSRAGCEEVCANPMAWPVLYRQEVKILVGTDFSSAAEAAARTAAAFARKLGDSLVLVRVIEPPAVVYPELSVTGAQATEAALRKSVETQLAHATAALREQGLQVEGRVLIGVPEQVLVDEAREEEVRLLVLGTHGRRGLARFFLGSVAERTTLEAPCPVLIVREGPSPLAEWADGRRPLKLMVGVDLSQATHAALAWLGELRRIAPCDVVLVHHYWPPREYTRLGLPGPRDVFDTDSEVAAALERDLHKHIGSLPGEGRTDLRVYASWIRPGEALAEAAAAAGVDLLILGTHQPHGWERVKAGSSALIALRTAGVPVLCVPAALRPPEPARTPIPVVRTVLAATDFSPLGNSSVPHACSLLRGGGVLELCHVRERKLPAPVYAYESRDEALTPAERTEIEARLRALVPQEAERLGIEVRVTVVDGGEAREAIVQAASRLGADAICVATHGRSGVGRAILGSVTQAVVAGAECPVYVVRALHR
jgi:nucleotide-binding universal stress UspA family protein